MPTVYYGPKDQPSLELEQSDDLIAIRTRSRGSITDVDKSRPTPQSDVLEDSKLVVAYVEAGVEVYRVPVGPGVPTLDERKAILQATPNVQFAGGVLIDPLSKQPVLYTENIFIKFIDSVNSESCAAKRPVFS
jgi:hypothetical protein